MIKTVLSILVLAPALSFAATKKTTATAPVAAPVAIQTTETSTTAPTQQTTFRNDVVNFNTENLKGLSIFGAYDMTDTVSFSEGSSPKVDKAFVLGGLYQFSQFEPGVAAQVGGTYEFDRKVKNSDVKLGMNTAFGEIDLKVSPKLSLNGGVNYSFPSFSGVEGASISGKLGFQAGASYATKGKFSIDAKYRIVSTEINIDAANKTIDADLKGLSFYGRYNF